MNNYQKIRSFFTRIGAPRLGRSITAFCSEPIHSLRASIYYLLGYLEPFCFYQMNPHKIRPSQVKKRAILLIHGNFHNQSAWIALAKSLTQSNLGPIYTVNLNPGPLTEADREVINAKIAEIRSQYDVHGAKVVIDIIGHSRGSEMAFLTALEDNCWQISSGFKKITSEKVSFKPEIGRVIRVGTPTDDEEKNALPRDLLDRIYEIDASNDSFVLQKSQVKKTNRILVDTGHLGLLFSPTVHRQILLWLT